MPDLRQSFEDGKFTDLKLVCEDGVEFNVHKVVVCSQSSFFDLACTVDMREKEENLITLPESSDAVRTLLGFCYSGEYQELDKDESEGCKALHHAEVYVAAKKYQIDGLARQASQWLTTELRVCQERLVQCESSATQSSEVTQKQTHQISSDSFEDLLNAISVILEGTPDDDSIRDLLLLNWSKFKPTGVYRASWLEFLCKHPGYAADVMEAQGKRESKLVGKMDKLIARHKRDISSRKDKHKSILSQQKTATDSIVANYKRALELKEIRINQAQQKPCRLYEQALDALSAGTTSTDQWISDRARTMVSAAPRDAARIANAQSIIRAHRQSG